jgi:hypothetical protein
VEMAKLPRYMPDYEVNALGCMEQFQACIPVRYGGRVCTEWMGIPSEAIVDVVIKLYRKVIEQDDSESGEQAIILIVDGFTYLERAIIAMSVH